MIKGVIIGSEAITARFERMKDAMPKLTAKIQKVVVELQGKVIKEKLSGQVLKVRSNNLRSSIHQTVSVDGSKITGIVGTNVEYAAFHEYGFSGNQNIKEHLRTIKIAFGKPLKKPKIVTVRAHQRSVEYPEHSFLRSELANMADEIRVAISEGTKEIIGS